MTTELEKLIAECEVVSYTPARELAAACRVLVSGLKHAIESNSVFEDSANVDPWEHISAVNDKLEQTLATAEAIAKGESHDN